MKLIDGSNISNIVGQRFKGGTLGFLQDIPTEIMQDLIQSIYGIANNSFTAYILYGLVDSGSAPAYNISAGAIYYNGKIYRVPAASGTLSGGNVVILNYTRTPTTDADHDPTLLTTNSSVNVHFNDTWQIAQGLTGTGTYDFLSLTYVNSSTITRTSINNGLSLDVNIVGSAPFTYTNLNTFYAYTINEGVCHLHFKASLDISDGAIVDQIKIPLPNGIVKSTNGTEQYSFRGSASYDAPGSTTDYAYLQVNAVDDGTEGQRFVLRRFDGTTLITISTGITVTLRGFIEIPLA